MEKNGSLEDIHAIQSPHPFKGEEILKEEAVRVITLSGMWEPTKQDGQIVRSYKIQPITFKMERE